MSDEIANPATDPRCEKTEGPAELSPVEAQVVALVLSGEAIKDIAETVGRSSQFVYVIRQRPHVKAAILAGLQGGLEQARAKLAASSGEVADALAGIARGEQSKPDAVQVQAAKAVLEYAIKLGEFAGDGAPKKSEVAVTGGVAAIPVWSGSQADFEKAAMSAQEQLQAESQPDHGDEEE